MFCVFQKYSFCLSQKNTPGVDFESLDASNLIKHKKSVISINKLFIFD